MRIPAPFIRMRGITFNHSLEIPAVMLNDDSVSPARRTFGTRSLRLVATGREPTVRPRTQSVRGAVPRTAEEWTALVKVGSGETDIPDTQCQRLRAMGLVVTISGRPALTRHGRFTLGLPD